jgi:vitamin K-dependent gamma-carboxylase
MPTATAEATARPAAASEWRDLLERAVPASSYVAFRAALGLLVAIGQLRFLARGWVEELYLAPATHLTYPGFGWVRPLPAPLMYAVVVGVAVAAVALAMGVRTRLCAAALTVGFAYCELIDAALYLNHYWFITLGALLLVVLPTAREGEVPVVTVWALRAQLAVVYVVAGLAKLNADWLIRAEPLATWLPARTDRPVIGRFLDEPFVAVMASWAGTVFDLTIVGWLLWRRSRPYAYAVLVAFHLATAMLFQIGMFPWVMIALTPIFFAPDWPRRLTGRRGARSRRSSRPIPSTTWWALAMLAMVNVLLPLRHYAADGNVRWNDDGYLLAWRVMLTERAADVAFEVRDQASGEVWTVRPSDVLTDWQAAVASVRTDLLLDTAHLIARQARADGHADVEISRRSPSGPR